MPPRTSLASPHLSNVRKAYALADEIDRAEGAAAYSRYHAMMGRIASHYGQPLETVAGVFAVLSPNNDYLGNLRSACAVLHGWREGWQVSEVVVTTYHHNRARAWEILSGVHPLDLFRGLKIRNFFQNIVCPACPWSITIDGHMVGIWHGERLTMDKAGISRTEYATLARGFSLVAEEIGCLPSTLQALLWFAWKRQHAVLYDAQTGLFDDPSDRWRIMRPLEEITRYGNGPFRKWTPAVSEYRRRRPKLYQPGERPRRTTAAETTTDEP